MYFVSMGLVSLHGVLAEEVVDHGLAGHVAGPLRRVPEAQVREEQSPRLVRPPLLCRDQSPLSGRAGAAADGNPERGVVVAEGLVEGLLLPAPQLQSGCQEHQSPAAPPRHPRTAPLTNRAAPSTRRPSNVHPAVSHKAYQDQDGCEFESAMLAAKGI